MPGMTVRPYRAWTRGYDAALSLPFVVAMLSSAGPLLAQTRVPTAEWAGLDRYREENALLPTAVSDRVVFMGNSIVEGWAPHFRQLFPGRQYIGRGISGQTTAQMLVRFRQDVISLRPTVVVILAGTNDIAGNGGPVTLTEIQGNLASMTELAQANGIRVVLCSVLPVLDYPWRPGLEPAAIIVALNAWLREYASQRDAIYVDLHSAMRDESDGMQRGLARDGVHPTEEGYRRMAPLVEQGIAAARRE